MQFVAKLRRKKLSDKTRQRISERAGMGVPSLLEFLHSSPLETVAQWMSENAALIAGFDRINGEGEIVIPVADQPDKYKFEEIGYGSGCLRPEDYIKNFHDFIEKNKNEIAALKIVLTRPCDLTRAELKQLRLKLDDAGYPEKQLEKAFKQQTNAEIAAGIIGYIRRAALGDPLMSYGERVDKALARILQAQKWSAQQQKWLLRISSQLKSEFVVDREALNSGQFKAEGGFNRINQVFEGRLEAVLQNIYENLWKKEA
jgi:type I restriction enzyme R subunit